VVALAANRQAASILWDWYVSRLDRIEQFHPCFTNGWSRAVLPAAGLERPDEVLEFFAGYQSKTDKARDVIRISLERLEINAGCGAATLDTVRTFPYRTTIWNRERP